MSRVPAGRSVGRRPTSRSTIVLFVLGGCVGGCVAGSACSSSLDRATPRSEPITASVSTSAAVPATSNEPTAPTTETVETTETRETTETLETVVSTTTSEPEIELPAGVLVAVPQQNREDPAKGRFQVQIVNDTDDRFDVSSVQFVWEGFTTEVVPRDSIVVGGQTIDFPLPLPGATCAGDGTQATMPSLDTAVVVLGAPDGTAREVPVIDKWHLARRLYLDDCRRQRIDAVVTIEWADLHEAEFEGRPVTAGVLRLNRGSATGEVRVESVSGTIPYSFEAVDTEVGETVAVLPAGEDTVEVPIRFTEGRCDPHALAEAKQPHEFVLQVDLGDGVLLPHVVRPDPADFVPMRRTADEACVVTGQVVFVGD